MKNDTPDPSFMRMAITAALKGISEGQSPFGACIVRDGNVLSCTHNTVWKTTDSTAHAEINAIRDACRMTSSIDLSGATIYSTTEPCPMCFSAIHWAKISRIVFGTRISDAREAGFSELDISNDRMAQMGHSNLVVVPDFLRDEARGLFRQWNAHPARKPY